MEDESTKAMASGALAFAAPGALAAAAPRALADALPQPAVEASAMEDKAAASGALAFGAPAALAVTASGGLAATPGGLDVAPGGLNAAPGALADVLQQPTVEAPIDVVALARALLPTAPHPEIEYNLPILRVERYKLHALISDFCTYTVVFTSTVVDSSNTWFRVFLGPK
jgi:hypothetical protein